MIKIFYHQNSLVFECPTAIRQKKGFGMEKINYCILIYYNYITELYEFRLYLWS